MPSHNWAEICMTLRKAGYGCSKVARELNLAPSTVSEWSKGREPRHSSGEKLLAFLAKVLKANGKT